MLLTIIVFLFILGLLIFIHELGHFLAAKAVGVEVEEFAFGYPPRLWGIKWRQTKYLINLIPWGGYVKLKGDLGDIENYEHAKSLLKKSVPQRFLVMAAGVLMNLIFAGILLGAGFNLGMTPIVSAPSDLGGTQTPMILVVEVQPDSPAQKAGIIAGEQIISAAAPEEIIFQSAQDLARFTKSRQGQPVVLTVKNLKDDSIRRVALALGEGEVPLGIYSVETAEVKLSLIPAIIAGFKEGYLILHEILRYLGGFFSNLFGHAQIASEVTGPIGIYAYVDQAVKLGFIFVLQLTALLSLNLGLINFLPFPALDGGRGVFILLEGIFGRRVVREKWESLIHNIGFVFLILLMLLITFRDIIRLR